MQYAWDFLKESIFQNAIDELLVGIEERCKPKTGLWGYETTNSPDALSEGVQAGYYFWLLYWYEGREIPYAKKAFDSINRLQNRFVGFNLKNFNSSACEDIDALVPLVRLAISYPHLKQIALPVVCKGLRWVLYNFNTDGGACFQRDASFRYGHDLMFSRNNESSIFSTWFRMLTIAYCCELLKEHYMPELAQCRFYYLVCPGLQYSPYHRLPPDERK